ncbi:carbohydrate ABC transporter permease [Microvirga sp. GCM10011540]|uniref:carbohydrate ABC transporter permease n=1 Tax=Microvirga sp. GCM10011540 TaxID=3317338 RepID=UPI0036195EC7
MTSALIIGQRRQLAATVMLAPLVLGLTVFAVYPLVYLIGLAFTRSELGRQFQEYVGWENFDWALTGTIFPTSLWNTVIFAFVVSGAQLVLGLAIAYLLYRYARTGRIIRTLILLPMMTPPVMVGVAWKLILNPSGGWLNGVLLRSGLIERPVSFLGDAQLAFPSIMLADTWQWTPLVVILCFAALQSLPKDVFEAAAIDGAYDGAIFWRLTLPMIAPSLVAIFLMRLVMAFKTFDLVYILTFGGPGNATSIASFEIWKTALREFDVGLAAAQTLLLAITVSIVTLPVVIIFNWVERRT